MTTQAFIILTAAQAIATEAANGSGSYLDARPMDNPIADNLGFGTLLGKEVIPARVLNDPAHAARITDLLTYPIHVLDSETIFLPEII